MQLGQVPTSDLLSNLCSPQEPACLTLVFLNGAGKPGPMAWRGGSLLPWADPRTSRPRGVELCQQPRWSLRYRGCGSGVWPSEHQQGLSGAGRLLFPSLNPPPMAFPDHIQPMSLVLG